MLPEAGGNPNASQDAELRARQEAAEPLTTLKAKEGHTKEWEFKVSIYWPNTNEPEIRSEDNLMLHTLFNEFGLDGWKLITNIVTYTAIFRYDRFGMNETGTPIGQKYIFIRRRNL
jgi:hypothetical protein